MFTGIIENIGKIEEVKKTDGQIILSVSSTLSKELKIDQSVAHNGICLTVTACNEKDYTVCAVQETIDKTSIGNWKIEQQINLERGMIMGSRLDGHIVQGHVDTKGKCTNVLIEQENKIYTFEFDTSFANLIVEKGSIVINGVSLTCFNVTDNSFQVTIIPYTFEKTNFNELQKDDVVNLEFDILGKYFQRHLSLRKSI